MFFAGCVASSAPLPEQEERKAFRGGEMPPAVAAKIKAHQKTTATPSNR